MTFEEQIPLAQFTTFKIGGPARYFCRISSEAALVEAIRLAHVKRLPLFVLGGGSNILVSDAGFAGVVIKMEERGISYHDHDNEAFVSAAAGELWDDLVDSTVKRGLFGLENLSAIPGTVGAAPVQNIGAYGGEVSQVIEKVRVYDTRSLEFLEFDKDDCHFGYRDSVFKHLKKRYVITHVEFRLKHNARVNMQYKDLAQYFVARGISAPSLHQVRDAVIEVRRGKLPDCRLWGTAGSYFKNPVVPLKTFMELKQKHHDLPGHPEPDGQVKLPLGWILDKICNVRGFAMGQASTYEKQALVVVVKPGASAVDVINLTKELMWRVQEATGLAIEAEVEWVN
jgi:UDP-N-acetylmuramate dehydrogenase